MYSFGDGFVDDQASLDLQDIVAMQATAVNDLQQLTGSLQREASALKALAEEQQRQINEMREQVGTCILID
ncbi:MAG: hypothetical protein MPL62_11970 [Alphaproteobacteria bacterium]|nr:hypothetical protein [Alphaproteobacteria bacterium]